MTNLIFLDTETTSLRPDRRAWDIGLIYRDADGQYTERSWFIHCDDLDLGNADLMSLNYGNFHERHAAAALVGATYSERYALTEVERLTRSAVIVGAVPNFDTEVLATRMRANGICPSWHYHLLDVETLAAGALRMPPPWDFNKLLAAYGLTYDEAERHTARGDARMARDLYHAVMDREDPAAVAGRLIEAAA